MDNVDETVTSTCEPPHHYWEFTGAGVVACACGEHEAEYTPNGGGWEVRLADGRSLFKREGRPAAQVGDELGLRARLT